MPKSPTGPGTALLKRGNDRPSHWELVERCSAALHSDLEAGKTQAQSMRKWTPAMRAAWRLEEARERVATSLVRLTGKDARAQQVYWKLVGALDTKVDINHTVKQKRTLKLQVTHLQAPPTTGPALVGGSAERVITDQMANRIVEGVVLRELSEVAAEGDER